MRIPTWNSSKGDSADRNGDTLPPNEGERLQAKCSDATVEAQSAAKQAAATAEKYIAALKLIGTALRDLSNRIITLEHRSSETDETFENLRKPARTTAGQGRWPFWPRDQDVQQHNHQGHETIGVGIRHQSHALCASRVRQRAMSRSGCAVRHRSFQRAAANCV
jgi:hypothetical protein